MITIFLSFCVLLLVVVGMSIGVIMRNKPIKGSCGGMAALGIDTSCDICGGDATKCEEENQSKDSVLDKNLAYEAKNNERTAK
ncbi:(Na+)-NQR maturation NqrM [Aurantivibrio infirmus]